MVEIFVSFLLTLFPASFAISSADGGGGCGINACTQSHVSTTGSNIFSLGCTAQFANEGCNGAPIVVQANRCLDHDVIEAFWTEEDDGKSLPPGSCGPEVQMKKVSCNEACVSRGFSYGSCFQRQVLCFSVRRPVGYCYCG